MALSRSSWVEAALEALAEVGLGGVAVEPLARRLGASKGSFYWHFTDRADLIAATLAEWEQRDTADVIAALSALAGPEDRLLALARYALSEAEAGTDAQAGVLAAAADPRVRPTLDRVTRTRLEWIESIYRELGCDAEHARRRARLCYALYVGIGDLRRIGAHAPGNAGVLDLTADVDLLVKTLLPSGGQRERSAAP